MNIRRKHLSSFSSLTALEKPGRYLGGELNSRRDVFSQRAADFCLVFPDVYEIGISYYGYQILYHILNSLPDVSCDRAYLPWADMQDLLFESKIPLFSVESGRALRDFNAVGITLQTEFHYTGVVRILELSGIPLYAAERKRTEPIIIGGGPCAFHPEPIAPFFDAFLTGDGEEAIVDVANLIKQSEFKKLHREEKWYALSEIQGVYVPGLYEMDPTELRVGNPSIPVKPKTRMIPRKIKARIVSELKQCHYPQRPIVPVIPGTHDRLTIEIMRGCSQGCRFCQAGMVHRPVRERSEADIVQQILDGLDATGWDEVGLLSLSTSDYTNLSKLLHNLSGRLQDRRVSLSFPSLRPSSFTEDIAKIQTGGRKKSLTFALEAGSDRLRSVINKAVKEEELFEAVDRAFRHGWQAIKLYFMVGLPTETDDDIREGNRLLQALFRSMPKGKSLRISVAPFIPKPHSVFEREMFGNSDDLWKRQKALFDDLKHRKIKTTYRDVNESRIETVLSRGDRRLARVIEAVAKEGYGFDGWGNFFKASIWYKYLDELLPDWQKLLDYQVTDKPVSWEHLRKGFATKFFRDDLKRAYSEQKVPDCRLEKCNYCGLMRICENYRNLKEFTHLITTDLERGEDAHCSESFDRLNKENRKSENPPQLHHYRIYFSKLGKFRYIGHQDMMHAIERSLQRMKLPLFYSQGFNPRPKISYAPAISLGMGAKETWINISLVDSVDGEELLRMCRSTFPNGIKPIRIVPFQSKKDRILQSSDEHRNYRIRFNVILERNLSSKALESSDVKRATGILDWNISDNGRTLYFTLGRIDGKFLKPLDAAVKLLEEVSANYEKVQSSGIQHVTLLSD